MMHVLITPLGFSPGAVTGLALALNNNFDRCLKHVVTVGTAHRDTKAAAAIVDNVLKEANIAYDPRYIRQLELLNRTETQEDAARDYMIAIGQVMDDYRDQASHIHVGVTAGRSGMGALAALATNVYGADYLWHFWVDADIEENGRLGKIRPPYDRNNVYLNPTASPDENRYDLVALPFLDLRPLHPIIEQHYRNYRSALEKGQSYQAPEPISYLLQQLIQAGIHRLGDIFPASLPIGVADWIFETQRIFPLLSQEEKVQRERKLVRFLERHQIVDTTTESRLIQLMQIGGNFNQLLKIGERDADRKGFWNWLRENPEHILSAITAGSALTQALLQAVTVWLMAGGGG